MNLENHFGSIRVVSLVIVSALLLIPNLVLPGLSAQTDNEAEEEETIEELSPFVVNEAGAQLYQAVESVSATRIAIPLTRVPQRVTVLTKELLEDLKVFGTDEAIYYAGAERFRFQQSAVSIRGFRASTQIDNLNWGTDIKMDSIIINRLDVAKGPAGTIYGTGTPGGAVNMITNKPLPDFGGHLRLLYGSRDSYRIEGDVSGSFDKNKTLRYRLSAARDRLETELLFGEMTLDTLMPQFSWHPTPNTTVEVQVIYQHTPDWQPFDERFPTVGGDGVQPPNPDFEPRNAVVGFTPGVPENFNVPGPNSQRTDTSWLTTINWEQKFGERLSMRLAYRNTDFDEKRWTRFMMAGASLDDSGNVIDPNLRVGNWYQEKQIETDTVQVDFNFDWELKNGVHGSIVTGGNYRWFDQANAFWWDIGCCGQTTPPRGNTINIINPSTDPNSPDWSFSTFKEDFELNNFEDSISHNEGLDIWAVTNTYFANDRANLVFGWRRTYSLGDKATDVRGSRYDNRGSSSATTGESQSLDTFMVGGTVEIVRKENDYVTAFFGLTESNAFNQIPFDPRAGSGIEGGLRFSAWDRKVAGSISYYDLTQENILRNDPNLGNELVLSGKEAAQGFELEMFFYPFDGAMFFFSYVNQETEIVSHVQLPFLEGNPAGDGGYETAFSGAFTYSFPSGKHQGAGFTLGVVNRGEVAPFPDNAGTSGHFGSRLTRYST